MTNIVYCCCTPYSFSFLPPASFFSLFFTTQNTKTVATTRPTATDLYQHLPTLPPELVVEVKVTDASDNELVGVVDSASVVNVEDAATVEEALSVLLEDDMPVNVLPEFLPHE
jgi:hypothetical protein